MEKKALPSQPGLEPGSSAYATDALPGWDGSAFFFTFANASLPLLFRFNLSPFLRFKMLTLSVRDAQWRRDGTVGADIVKWALDEAYVVKQRRDGVAELIWMCASPSSSNGRASVA